MQKDPDPQAAQPSLTEVQLYVAGDHTFTTDVLAGHLSTETRLPGHGILGSRLANHCNGSVDKPMLLFMDCSARGVRKVCIHTGFQKNVFQNPHCRVICFNLNPNGDRDKQAITKGVDGIIYAHQSLNCYVKAAHAVLDAELWYPRHMLEQHLFASDAVPAAPPAPRDLLLTKREQEILNLLTVGLRNSDISTKLCISSHTVKTHVYNLYKKIQVTNRYEAVQWLATYG